MGCTTFEIGLQFPWLCTASWGSQYIFTEFSQHCNATCSTVILFGWGLCSALHWSSSEDFRGECWTALFADTSSTWTPLVCHSHPPVSSYFCQDWRFIYFFNFFYQIAFFPLFFSLFPVCATFNSDAGSAAKPSPATISRFARISPRNHHLLSSNNSCNVSLRNHYS